MGGFLDSICLTEQCVSKEDVIFPEVNGTSHVNKAFIALETQYIHCHYSILLLL